MVINIKNKYILIIFSLFSAFTLINTATAIPLKQSSYNMDKLNTIEDLKNNIDIKLNDLMNLLSVKLVDYYPTGIIENLINFLIKLIEFIINFAEFVSTLLNLGERILIFINQLIYIIDTIINIINWILDLFSPGNMI